MGRLLWIARQGRELLRSGGVGCAMRLREIVSMIPFGSRTSIEVLDIGSVAL
jgi:hypothetical protein